MISSLLKLYTEGLDKVPENIFRKIKNPAPLQEIPYKA